MVTLFICIEENVMLLKAYHELFKFHNTLFIIQQRKEKYKTF